MVHPTNGKWFITPVLSGTSKLNPLGVVIYNYNSLAKWDEPPMSISSNLTNIDLMTRDVYRTNRQHLEQPTVPCRT